MSRPHPPVPGDLAEIVGQPGMSYNRAAQHYGVHRRVIMHWCAVAGVEVCRTPVPRAVSPRRPMPDDFIEMRAKLGGIDNLVRHYRSSTATVRRWLQEAGAAKLKGGRSGVAAANRRPMPDDFAEQAQIMGKTALTRFYKVNANALERWFAESGLTPIKPLPQAYRRPALRYVRTPSHSNVAQTRTYSEEDLAADVLRRWGPVYRCKASGEANHKGTHWRIGWTVLTGEELIERARRKAITRRT